MAKRRREDEDLDFGKSSVVEDEPVIEDEPEEQLEQKEERVQELVTDMNRIVPSEDEVRFSGSVREGDIPQCPCCHAVWYITEGTIASPGCGCMIHPVCSKCDRCEAHCEGHRK
jgi:hypothetical protein